VTLNTAVLFITILPLAVQSAQAHGLRAPWVNGHALVEIDGNLDDWDRSGIRPLVQVYSPLFNSLATIRCLADHDNFYLAVQVRTQTIPPRISATSDIFEHYGIDIAFYGGQSHELMVNQLHRRLDGRLSIRLDTTGRTLLEGSTPSPLQRISGDLIEYPYLWQALGARASLLPDTTGGYVVEVSIPSACFFWTNRSMPESIGLAVAVNTPEQEEQLLWSKLPNDSLTSAETLHTISFETSTTPRTKVIGDRTGDATAPAVSRSIQCLFERNALAAATVLLPLAQNYRILPMLGAMQMAAHRYDDSKKTLDQALHLCPESRVKGWIHVQLARYFERIGDHSRSEVEYQRALTLLSGTASLKVLMEFAEAVSRTRGGEAAVNVYKSAIQESAQVGKPALLLALSKYYSTLSHNSDSRLILQALTLSNTISSSVKRSTADELTHQCLLADPSHASMFTPVEPMRSTSSDRSENTTQFLRDVLPDVAPGEARPLSELIKNLEMTSSITMGGRLDLLRAKALEENGQVSLAEEQYRHLSTDSTLSSSEQAGAALALQRLQLRAGRPDDALETAINIQDSYPGEIGLRWRSVTSLQCTSTTTTLSSTSTTCASLADTLISTLRSIEGGPYRDDAALARVLLDRLPR